MRTVKQFCLKTKTAMQGGEKTPLLTRSSVWFFLMPLLLLGGLEILHLTNGNAAVLFFSSPYFLLKYLLTYLFLLAAQCAFWCITQNGAVAALLNGIVFYLLALVTDIRIALTGDPLLPTDLLLIRDVAKITGFVDIPVNVFQYISAFVILATCLTYFALRRKAKPTRMQLWVRLSCIAVSVVLFAGCVYSFCISYDFRHRTLKNMDVTIVAFNPVDNYRSNGLILEFFPRIGDMFVSKLEGYSAEKLEEIKQQYADAKPLESTASKLRPNVIFIQNEALWDVYAMQQTTFSVDPMQHIRSIAEDKNARFGKMMSSVFAGGTCLPEFEALTGLNCRYLQTYGYPYVQYITGRTPSIVSAFRDNGYQTVAFHPYHKNFYSRDRAYPMLGFDAFYGMDDMQSPEKSGWYISDMASSGYIIDTYQHKTADRLFMFTVTMQNHGGYNPARYTHYDVEVKNANLSAADLQGLQDFTQGVYEADLAYAALVDYFKTVDEPTVIVMYGDHLPLLGTDGSTYRDGGYVENVLPFESNKYEQLYETPYILWANYDIGDVKFEDKMSAGNIGIELLKLSGLKNVPWYFKALDALYDAMPVVNPYFLFDAAGNAQSQIPASLEKTQQDFKYIQYDLLHGKHYVTK